MRLIVSRAAVISVVAAFVLPPFQGAGASPEQNPKLSNAVPVLIAKVEPEMLAGSTPVIESFDISPDNTRLALSYGDGPYHQEQWTALWDISENRAIWRTKLGDSPDAPLQAVDPAGPILFSTYLWELQLRSKVLFSPDAGRVIAMGLGKVWILDGQSGSIIREISLPQFALVAAVDIQTMPVYTLAVTYQYGFEQFEVDFYDLATGSKVSGWLSRAIPQSFSPDGKLVVAADPSIRNGGGVTNIQVMDTRSGAKLKSIPVGFRFAKTWLGLGPPTAKDTVVSQFLNNEEILVAPGGGRDGAGYSSGSTLQVINIPQGRIVREILPKKFGPTGVLAESADHRHFMLESLHATAASFASDSPHPKDYRHEVMIFANGSNTPESVVPWPDTPQVPPKISADASTLALVVNGNVLIFHFTS